ncbi:LOW QUALITY PROTEIN: fibronectin type III and SPRY domain-containing protein 2 [Sceloporus undulatus]|uniref:LOW QUALITY PROTEIN: fibronectin type III and SPRY domain-containing protein 2 n=1 Tax=Sceloporus undulatus TaxID=8520 RepID=UPI001C4C1926|nr:LOW QUALITY PROTEIN: fibronectin type III and SPRY domain-containing protein 2 [Sceloporus undulatus]
MVSLLLLIQEALQRARLAASIPVTPMESQSEGNEPEGPRLYHLELYDSTEDLEMFSEPFRRRDLAVQENMKPQAPQKPTISSGDFGDQHPENETASNENDHDDLKTISSYNTENKESFKGMDTYCITCCVPLRALDTQCSDHEEHEVIPLVSVVQIAKDELQKNICKLENQIIHLESFSSHLEEIFITVEENFAREEHKFERRYDDMMQILEQRYEEMMQVWGEEKKEKLEALYEQLVSCGENLDTCKELMETIEDLGQGANKVDTIQTAVATMGRLEKFLKKDLDVDLSTPTDYEARVIEFSDVQQLMDSVDCLPAPLPPCAPVINPQDPSSATGTSVRVCWSFFSEDLVESYQLSYKRISNDTSKEEQAEFVLNVKETYCTVTNLAPNTQYEFWVKALNRAGVSSSSERAVYMTAPLPPVIKRKAIQSCEHAALVCWECGNTNPVDSYTVELSRLTDGEDENFITESIVGIPNCETLIQLEPQQNYIISVKALNTGGSSERSDTVSIFSTGTSFTLNEETAHPFLSVLEDGLTILCRKTERPRSDLSFCENSFTRSIAILGNPIPFRGKHYWEVDVDENIEYRVGVAFENAPRDSYLGMSHSSWCMRHTVTASRHTYEFLNNGMTPDIKITIPPSRIGLLLDYDKGTLSFFNTYIMQHLYTFHSLFQDFVCPCFAVEEPGMLKIRNGIAMPPYTLS